MNLIVIRLFTFIITFLLLICCVEKRDDNNTRDTTQIEESTDLTDQESISYPEMDYLMYLRSLYYEIEGKISSKTSYSMDMDDDNFVAVRIKAYYNAQDPLKLERTEVSQQKTSQFSFYLLNGELFFIQENNILELNTGGDILRSEIRSYVKDGKVILVLKKEKEIKFDEKVDMDKEVENTTYTNNIPDLEQWLNNYYKKYWQAQYKIESKEFHEGLSNKLIGYKGFHSPAIPIIKESIQIQYVKVSTESSNKNHPFLISVQLKNDDNKRNRKPDEKNILVSPDYYLLSSDTIIFKGQHPKLGRILFFGNLNMSSIEERMRGRFYINDHMFYTTTLSYRGEME